MRILITGSKGFVGRNLVSQLKNIRDGKIPQFSNLKIDEIFEFDINSKEEELDRYCREVDFVFHLAGVNRPKDPSEFMLGNLGLTSKLLKNLEKHHNKCPVMISSSIQASLEGRYAGSEYGKSKLEGEQLLFDYSDKTGAKVLVYRFPNIFGKWCRPNYNSVVATFCHNIANGLPIQVNDASTELELVYIDDLINEMVSALKGEEHRCECKGTEAIPEENGTYCFVPTTHKVTLGEIVDLLESFNNQPKTLAMPSIPDGSFAKKLYSTFLSYLPKEKISFELDMKRDERGSFTELIKTLDHGQMNVNIMKPGITKGQHWHHTKWELFIVVSGHGLIQLRKIGSDDILNFEVSGDKIEAVQILPGYTHNIINLSDSKNLVTLMWSNECFDPDKPDTYFEPV